MKERQRIATAMFQERCKKAGVFIHRTADNVEGVFLMKLRSKDINRGQQYELDDPYGRDLSGNGYITSLLLGLFENNVQLSKNPPPGAPLPPKGYLYAEAVDPKDGIRYRYTGEIVEPWQTDKTYLKGYKKFEMHRQATTGPMPRYGVTYDDISTKEERDYWIAGSSLRVIDLQTNEVIAERIGYMVDWAQGSSVGGRAPWLFAADNACPEFAHIHGSTSQIFQTLRFINKSLKPAQGE